jgi:hypothetical protein
MIDIVITTILGYSLKKEYVGTTNYRNVITVEVESLHKTQTNVAYDDTLPPVDIYSQAEVYQKTTTPIYLNGNGFGLGRVISVSEPRSVNFDENGIKFWKRNITIEFYEAGDDTNTPNSAANTFYARLKNNLFDPRIREISEDFSFTDDEEGNLGYTHTVTVSCDDALVAASPNNNTETGIYLARQKAQNLIESEVNFGYLGNLANLYGQAGKRTFSTQIDPINGTVTITKTFTSFLVKSPATYSFAVQDDGSINISESISFKNNNLATRIDLTSGIKSILDNVKTDAYSRCLGYFNIYKNFITKGESVDSLGAENISLISINRTFNEEAQEYTQQIVFSNARNLRSTYTLEIDQSVSMDEKGITSITENASFVSKVKKVNGTSQPFLADPSAFRALLVGVQDESYYRAVALYNKYHKTNITNSIPIDGKTFLKLINSSRRATSNGKTFGYSLTFNNDSSFARDGTINSVNSKINANIPKKIIKTYIVPGYTNNALPTNTTNKNSPIFSQENKQSTLGALNITQTALLKRTNANKTPDLVDKPIASINKLYDNCLLTLLNRLSSFGFGNPNNFIINSVSYSYNSSRNLEMSVGIIYFVESNKFGPKNTLYSN